MSGAEESIFRAPRLWNLFSSLQQSFSATGWWFRPAFDPRTPRILAICEI